MGRAVEFLRSLQVRPSFGPRLGERLRWRVQQLEHVADDLPQAALQGKVIVHQVDQEVIIMDVLDDHP